MRNSTETRKDGFTLTEFLVLIGVGSMLIGVLAADLSQTRMTLLQQACAANMKHWGMAFDLYSNDWGGSLYYDMNGSHFDDSPNSVWQNPYLRYLGGTNAMSTIRSLRVCPARAATMTQLDTVTFHSYSMPVGTYKRGLRYANADAGSSPFFDQVSFSYFPSLRFLPRPSSYLLLFEGRGNTTYCGGLVQATTTVHVGTGGDTIPAIARHGGGGVNCLFGDFHVEFVSSQVITNVDATSCTTGNPWFMLN
jgi:prepilin-type processing-associated H-X9-DG protein